MAHIIVICLGFRCILLLPFPFLLRHFPYSCLSLPLSFAFFSRTEHGWSSPLCFARVSPRRKYVVPFRTKWKPTRTTRNKKKHVYSNRNRSSTKQRRATRIICDLYHIDHVNEIYRRREFKCQSTRESRISCT